MKDARNKGQLLVLTLVFFLNCSRTPLPAAPQNNNTKKKVILQKGCIDRTGEMAQIKGHKECPPLVACNLMEADNGTPMCGMIKGTWGEFRNVYNDKGQLVQEQDSQGNVDSKCK